MELLCSVFLFSSADRSPHPPSFRLLLNMYFPVWWLWCGARVRSDARSCVACCPLPVASPAVPLARAPRHRPPAPRPGRARLLAVVDEGVAAAHPSLVGDVQRYCAAHADALELTSPPLVVPGGEAIKNEPGPVSQIRAAIDVHGVDRHSYVMAVGGGAVLDTVGYAAATAHRGVRLIRVPTTVLAQDDSAVGVKNGINAFGKKNFVGSFAPPHAVLNDFDLLLTLQDRDWRAGISEAVKVALLKDAPFFAWIEHHARELADRSLPAMAHLVHRSAELHLTHIATSGDPFELGSSRPLDFGHWAAHKLEQLSRHELRHGEAVAIGIALDSTYSYLTGSLPQDRKSVV